MADIKIFTMVEPAFSVGVADEGDEGPLHILCDQCDWRKYREGHA